jgi:peptidyl-dipeptidase A
MFSMLFLAALLVAPRPTAAQSRTPTVEEARRFAEDAERRLLDLWIRYQRASWVQSTYITDDTERLAAEAQEAMTAATMELAAGATRFDSLRLPEQVARKLKLIKLSITVPAPRDPAERTELSRITTSMESDYGRGRWCPQGEQAGKGGETPCLDLGEISRRMAASRDAGELLDLWNGWHAIAPPLRQRYQRFAELGNKGARELGLRDLGELWRAGYDMKPEEFAAELERLWRQLRPLYEALHAHARAGLLAQYGPEVVPAEGPIPAHLTGNMWAQSWINIYPLLAPPEGDPGYDLTKILQRREVDEREMVRYGERFFVSLGFDPLPKTFWERSLFEKPADRDVVCHASAWDIDYVEDLRLKMCVEINEEDFATVHHELGHNYYQRAYNRQPPLFRDSANDGFHEAIGDVMALSVTPAYLQEIGLLKKPPRPGGDLGFLMKMALERVAFFPFGLVVDQWRWKVFSGETQPSDYNRSWWDLRRRYQGVGEPQARSEADFDPGAKYHIPANTPYSRYFVAHVLQFQIHRDLCRQIGHQGPLHECSIYGNREAGERLKKMLEMGRSRPWPDALEALTGERRLDAGAVLEYFAPLRAWLDEQNAGRPVGW